MSDIAQLGLSVTSKGIDEAAQSLNALASAAQNAESNTQSVAKSAAANDNALAKSAAAVNDLGKAHAGMSTNAMAAFHSVRSMTEGLAMGMPVTTVLAQQINHLSYAASGPGGLKAAFGEVLGSFTKLVSPTVLVGGAFAAVAVGGALAVKSLVNTEKAFDDVSRAAGVSIGQLHALADAASMKGISSDDFLKSMEKFASDVDDAQHSMGSLGSLMRANGQSAQGVADAMAKVADLIQRASSDQQRLKILQEAGLPATMDWVRFLQQGPAAIRQAVVEAGNFNDAATRDMVAKAREFDEQWNKAFTNFKTWARGATLEVAGWLNELGRAAGNFGSSALDTVGLSKHQQGLNQLKTGSGVPMTGYSDQFAKLGPQPAAQQGGQGKVTTSAELEKSIAQQQQYISLLGQTATAEQQVKSVELSIAAFRQATGISLTKDQTEALKSLAYESALGITAMKQQADAERVSAATLGMSAGEAARYTAVQNQLNAAKRNHSPLSQQAVADINAEANALGKATQAAESQKFAFDQIQQIKQQTAQMNIQAATAFMNTGDAAAYTAQMNALAEATRKNVDLNPEMVAGIKAQANALGQATQNAENMKAIYSGLIDGPSQTFINQIMQGAKAMDAFKAAGMNALNAIAQQLMKMAMANLFGNIFGGAGGGGGIFSGLGSLFGGVHHGGYGPGDSFKTRAVDPAVFAHAPRFHSGIGAGERAAVIQNDESVLTPGQMKQLAPVGQQSGGVQGIKADIGVSVDDDGKLMAVVKNITKQMIGDFAGSPQFVNHVASATKTARTQRKL